MSKTTSLEELLTTAQERLKSVMNVEYSKVAVLTKDRLKLIHFDENC